MFEISSVNILEKYLGLIKKFSEKFHKGFRIILGECFEEKLNEIETNFEGFPRTF